MKVSELKKIASIAIEDHFKVKSCYKETERIIEPFYLFKNSTNGKYYLVSYCHYRQHIRNFNLSNFTHFQIIREEGEQKPFTFKQWYDKSKSEIDFFDFNKLILYFYPISQKKRLEKSGVRFAENESIRKKDPNKFPKKVKFSKMEKESIIRSPLEEIIFTQLNEDSYVEKIEIEPLKISYVYNRVYRKYIPDALLTFSDGHKELIEIKLSIDTQYKKNLAKFEAAESYAKENNMIFRVIGVQGETNKGNYSNWSDSEDIPEIEIIDWKGMSEVVNQSLHSIKSITTKYISGINWNKSSDLKNQLKINRRSNSRYRCGVFCKSAINKPMKRHRYSIRRKRVK